MMRPDQEQTCSAWLDQDHSWSAQILADTDRHTGLANIIVVGLAQYHPTYSFGKIFQNYHWYYLGVSGGGNSKESVRLSHTNISCLIDLDYIVKMSQVIVRRHV